MAQRQRPTRPIQRVPSRRPATPSPYTRRRATAGSNSGRWFLVLAGLILALGYVLYDRTLGAIADTERPDVRPKSADNVPPPALLQQPFNVLLIGVDARDASLDDGARSDTLIVVHVDPVDKWASMLSIPRDSYVKIPFRTDVEGDKITLAYSWGYRNPEIYGEGTRPADAGAALAADTVEEFLGITIDYTAQVDFKGFEKLVDAMDGITIDVPHAILDAEYPTEDYGYMRLFIEPGIQHMDGKSALRYARTRHADSDFGRGERQQQVLQAVLSELKQRGILGKIEALPEMLAALRENVSTTMHITDLSILRGLASLAQEMGTDRIQRYRLDPDTVALDQRFDNRYDLHWDEEEVKKLGQQFQMDPGQVVQAPETATIQVLNGTGTIKGLAGRVTLDLELEGFTLAEPADAPTDDNPHTLILDYSGKPQTREKLAKYFGLDPEFVRDESANKEKAPLGVDIVVLLGQDYKSQSDT